MTRQQAADRNAAAEATVEGLSPPAAAIVIAVIYSAAIVRILNKPATAAAGAFSILNIVMLWVFAVAGWPPLPGSGRR